jgi:hypothetical protein
VSRQVSVEGAEILGVHGRLEAVSDGVWLTIQRPDRSLFQLVVDNAGRWRGHEGALLGYTESDGCVIVWEGAHAKP